MAAIDVNRTLADFAVGLRHRDLLREVIETAKLHARGAGCLPASRLDEIGAREVAFAPPGDSREPPF